MNFQNDNVPTRSGSKLALGIIFVLIGFTILGINYGTFPENWWNVIFTWQTVLILIGIILLFSRNGKLSGGILIIIGGVFLVPEFTGYHFHFTRLVFPLLIILIGLSILFKRGKKNKLNNRVLSNSSGYLNETAIFSGSEIIFTDDIFNGGTITAIFGGYHLDLTKTNLPLGTTFLDITAVFGGVEIVVPEKWKVTIKTTSVFGAFEDKRHNKIVFDSERELVITGTAIFGGGELKAH